MDSVDVCNYREFVGFRQVGRHKHSLTEIGAFYGGRDHATVSHSTKRVRVELAKDADTRRSVENVFRALGRPVPLDMFE